MFERNVPVVIILSLIGLVLLLVIGRGQARVSKVIVIGIYLLFIILVFVGMCYNM